jgi:quinol monooxygenase YgiN
MEVFAMFARFLEINIKLDRKAEIIKKVKEEVVPILRKYNGFFDLIPLDVETDPTKFYAISLWHEKADMEKYTREHFPKVRAMMEPFLTGPIIVKHCTIDETIPKKFLAAAMA